MPTLLTALGLAAAAAGIAATLIRLHQPTTRCWGCER